MTTFPLPSQTRFRGSRANDRRVPGASERLGGQPFSVLTAAALLLSLTVPGTALFAQSVDSVDRFLLKREAMVEDFVRARGVESPEVLSVMRSVPRHLFVPEQFRASAYNDGALRVDSQYGVPEAYAVARMTELLDLRGTERVLEIGTGTGYHTAVLAKLGKEVFSMEIVPERAAAAENILKQLGYSNVRVHVGNGYEGLPDQGPFDAIVLTAAPEEIPEELVKQLKVGGKMVVPIGGFLQELQLIEKQPDGSLKKRRVDVVRMRPMVDVTDERPSGPPGFR